MFRSQIEKFYSLIFSDDENSESVPYANKVFMFYFSITAFAIVVLLIAIDIAENVSGV